MQLSVIFSTLFFLCFHLAQHQLLYFPHFTCVACVCVHVYVWGDGGSLNNIHIFCRQYLMRFSLCIYYTANILSLHSQDVCNIHIQIQYITHFKRTKQIKVRTKCHLKFLLAHTDTRTYSQSNVMIFMHVVVSHSINIWLLCIDKQPTAHFNGRKCIEHECKTWISSAFFSATKSN